MRWCYRLLASLGAPFIWLWLKNRALKGKEDPARLSERFGRMPMARPSGTCIWIHAASVGEACSVLPLIHKLHDADEQLHIVLSTGTVTSARMIAGRLPERAFHLFVPVDIPFAVRRFLNKLKPDLAIWVESEFWPNLLYQVKARGVPVYLVNARISERSCKRWMWMRGAFANMMRCFEMLYAGSQADKQRLHQLGASKVQWAGNLKYDTQTLPADPKDTSAVLQAIGDRRVWLASSTHAGEEEMIAQAHRKVREVFPDLLTIIAPRHPHRRDEIMPILSQQKLTTALRSKQQVLLPETDIYLADTLGELGIFYRLSGVVFMGGSLVEHGGHNPIEPAQLDCAILCGPHMQSFANIISDLKDCKAAYTVLNADELADKVTELLRDHDAQEGMAERAHKAVDAKRGAADAIAAQVLQRLHLAPKADDEPQTLPGDAS